MKQILKISLSVLFLTTVSVFSVRYFLTQKINQNNLSVELKNLIQNHFKGTNVELRGFKYEVGSELIFNIDELDITNKLEGQSLFKVINLEMKVPLMSILTNKGKIKTSISKINYSYLGRSHLLKTISNNPHESRSEFPTFIREARHDIKIREFYLDQSLLGRLAIKNINLNKTTAFEMKKRFNDSEYINGDLRVIGEISIKDLLQTGSLNTLSSFSFENLQMLKDPTFKAFSGKGNFESTGNLGLLNAKFDVVSPDFFDVSGLVESDTYQIKLTELSGMLENTSLFPNLAKADLNFTGEVKLDKKSYQTDTMFDFKNLKPIVSDEFSTDLEGKISKNKLLLKFVSKGLEGEINSELNSKFNLKNIVQSNSVASEIDLKIKVENLNLNNFKFGEFLNKEKNFLKPSDPDFKFSLNFSNCILREQTFKGDIVGSKSSELLSIENFTLKDSKGEINGKFSSQENQNSLNLSAKLKNMELDFLKAIMGNRDIHVSGKFNGSVISMPDAAENKLNLDLKGTNGEVSGLYEVLQLKKVFAVASSEENENLVEPKDFGKFNELSLQLSISDEKLVVTNLVLDNKATFSHLVAEGSIFLKEGPSRILGTAKKRDISLEFLLEGNSIFFSPNITYTERKLQTRGVKK